MNSKRQTVWLVSMLSLMVVLSAYYLFTEDVNQLDPSTTQSAAVSANVDAIDSQSAALNEANSDMSHSDQNVLNQYAAQNQSQSGTDYFISLQLQRSDEVSKQTEDLLNVIADTSQKPEAVSAAHEQLKQMQRQEAMVAALQDELTQNYPQAVVMQDADQWKVIVESAKLDSSQAVSIIETAMKQLNVPQDKIAVQYVE